MRVEETDADTADSEAAGVCECIFSGVDGQCAVQVICSVVFLATIWDTELAGVGV